MDPSEIRIGKFLVKQQYDGYSYLVRTPSKDMSSTNQIMTNCLYAVFDTTSEDTGPWGLYGFICSCNNIASAMKVIAALTLLTNMENEASKNIFPSTNGRLASPHVHYETTTPSGGLSNQYTKMPDTTKVRELTPEDLAIQAEFDRFVKLSSDIKSATGEYPDHDLLEKVVDMFREDYPNSSDDYIFDRTYTYIVQRNQQHPKNIVR